ncbi:MAG: DUF1559 domain-containing protein [Pirellulaceae bacterium]
MLKSKLIRDAFTMVELLAVVGIIGVMVGLLLPAVQSARESARRHSCTNNLMQLGIATHAYHASFKQFPTQLSGTDGSMTVGRDNDRRLSLFVAIMPFLGQQAINDQIATAQSKMNSGGMGMGMGMEMFGEYYDEDTGQWVTVDDEADAESNDKSMDYLAGGPEPFQNDYLPWMTEIPSLRCPSDPGYGSPAMARNNYAASMGDGMVAINTGPMKSISGTFVIDKKRQAQTDAAMRGIFVPRVVTRRQDIRDGAAHTLMLGEIATDLGDQDVRTNAAVGPGEAILRDNPNWVYENDLIDPDRPMFWRTGTKSLTSATMNMNTIMNTSIERGFRWADGMPLYTGINTVLPPNSPIVLSGNSDDSSGYFSASSRHQGGALACLADNSVRFISDSIDTGDRSAPTAYVGSVTENAKSPFGIWGAMGTRSSTELVQVGESE